jgi:hypothetical protein
MSLDHCHRSLFLLSNFQEEHIHPDTKVVHLEDLACCHRSRSVSFGTMVRGTRYEVRGTSLWGYFLPRCRVKLLFWHHDDMEDGGGDYDYPCAFVLA